MRRSASEKMEVIRIVEGSELGVKRTLEELGISRSTFYEWYKSYLEEGFDGLKPKTSKRKSFWNKIPEKERQKVIETALDRTELSPRELAFEITDEQGWFISESSVYRILKEKGFTVLFQMRFRPFQMRIRDFIIFSNEILTLANMMLVSRILTTLLI